MLEKQAIEMIKQIEDTTPPCKGLFFRGYSTMFFHDNRIERKEGLRLLKKKSCKGGELCNSYKDDHFQSYRCDHWFLDEMSESIACECLIMPEIEDGKLYSVRITNMTHDFESGYCDDFDVEFFKVKEKKDEN